MSNNVFAYLTQAAETITSTFVQNGETLTSYFTQAARGAKGDDVPASLGGNGTADSGKVAEFGVLGELVASKITTTIDSVVKGDYMPSGFKISKSGGSIESNITNINGVRTIQFPDKNVTGASEAGIGMVVERLRFLQLDIDQDIQ